MEILKVALCSDRDPACQKRDEKFMSAPNGPRVLPVADISSGPGISFCQADRGTG